MNVGTGLGTGGKENGASTSLGPVFSFVFNGAGERTRTFTRGCLGGF